ncbi:MAG: hypothetical protein M3151_09075 [Actinomycetota bacterium]|nr:hypothetical protein [Actinomycetota bacterium]
MLENASPVCGRSLRRRKGWRDDRESVVFCGLRRRSAAKSPGRRMGAG